MSKNMEVKARSSQGGEFSMRSTTTDSPILPIAQLAELKEIAPSRVDWVFDETSKEAEFRRSEVRRANTLTLIHHLATLLAALLVVFAAIGASIYLAIIGQAWVAGTFATTTVGTLGWAFMSALRPRDTAQRKNSK